VEEKQLCTNATGEYERPDIDGSGIRDLHPGCRRHLTLIPMQSKLMTQKGEGVHTCSRGTTAKNRKIILKKSGEGGVIKVLLIFKSLCFDEGGSGGKKEGVSGGKSNAREKGSTSARNQI